MTESTKPVSISFIEVITHPFVFIPVVVVVAGLEAALHHSDATRDRGDFYLALLLVPIVQV